MATELFGDLCTQWRVGMNGPTGLDYASVPVVMKLRGIKRRERDEMFFCIRVMESEALQTMAEAREQAAK